MNRTEFTAAFREARMALRIFADTTSSHRRPLAERQEAEARWHNLLNTGRAAACEAVGAGLSQKTFLSNGAIFAYRHGLYTPDSSWVAWTRKKLATRKAVAA